MRPARVEFVRDDGRRLDLSPHVSALSLDLNQEGPPTMGRTYGSPYKIENPDAPLPHDLARDVPVAVKNYVRQAARMAQAYGLDLTVSKAAPKAPKWKVGDVVVLRFPGNPTGYTYCDDGTYFPGRTYRTSHTRADMTKAWDEGRATLLVRDGKPYEDVPVDERPKRQEALVGDLKRAARRSTYDYVTPW